MSQPDGMAPRTIERPASHRCAIACGAAIITLIALTPLLWLLARVIWLPFYAGVFFFLIAGLLAGAASFRIARVLRPAATPRIIVAVLLITLVAAVLGVWFEFRNIAATIGDPPRFADARAAAQMLGRPAADVGRQAHRAFTRRLAERFPPGGVFGYACWAVTDGHETLTLTDGFSDTVSIAHRRLAWLLRTVAAYVLLALGLWSQWEALRSPTPTTNILDPDQEDTGDAAASP